MISFRYHLVSIVAVFLALSLGVLIGTTVVNQGVLNQIKDRADASAKRSRDLEKQVADLQTQLSDGNDFSRAAEPLLVEGRLPGTEVVLVTQEGVNAGDLDGVRRTLQDAGAKVVAELVITKRMALTDATAQSELMGLVGASSSSDQTALIRAAAQKLAARLSAGPATPETDLLDQLRTAGFLIIRGGGTPEQIGSAFQSVVLLAGGSDPPTLDPSQFLQPLAVSLVDSARPVVAAETTDTATSLVSLIRNDGSMDGQLVTVDNADEIPGRVAVVYGLRDLLATPGKGGDYGVKDGASGILPRP